MWQCCAPLATVSAHARPLVPQARPRVLCPQEATTTGGRRAAGRRSGGHLATGNCSCGGREENRRGRLKL
ncbi:hypothetical protein BHE74_00040300 [Ensete ventricosum]|nr:hypothetical protein BHE74_00040300 [Ensete ventricosum]